jgi:hypothetical protein
VLLINANSGTGTRAASGVSTTATQVLKEAPVIKFQHLTLFTSINNELPKVIQPCGTQIFWSKDLSHTNIIAHS